MKLTTKGQPVRLTQRHLLTHRLTQADRGELEHLAAMCGVGVYLTDTLAAVRARFQAQRSADQHDARLDEFLRARGA